MRYTKGSFVITAEGDIPLLRQVRNSRFVSHQQLFELLKHDALVSSRSTFNWRIQRLLRAHHIERLEAVYWEGSPVYSVTQNGLLELESQGEFAVALHSGYPTNAGSYPGVSWPGTECNSVVTRSQRTAC